MIFGRSAPIDSEHPHPKPAGDLSLFDFEALRDLLSQQNNSIPLLKQALTQVDEQLNDLYRDHHPIDQLVSGRAWFMDGLLSCAWEQIEWPDSEHISLVAVGGYGRGELHPQSDIDILILTRKNRNSQYKQSITAFLTLLWDIGLDIGQSVRSIRQCKEEAIRDITVATALMESRTLVGPSELQQEMHRATHARSVWPIKKFLRAKWDEQLERHQKYHGVDYALEPNLKTSPGGLRDIQTIAWVAKRQYGAKTFVDLVEQGFITSAEEVVLNRGQLFLWKVRYGLHLLAGRREDRLLFDKQRELAQLFGYEDDENSLAVEKLMQEYYRTVGNLRQLNELLLQTLDEVILQAGERERLEPLNNRFQIRNDYIEVMHDNVFERAPYALLEIFLLLAQNPQIQGVRAGTIRLIQEHLHLINDDFRKDSSSVSLFMEILKARQQVARQLRRMARVGILGRYLPEFGKIIGQMQHDRFHIYTVDAHTLQVVENMRRFNLPGAEENFPVAAHIVKNLPKIELLYIAGLYHDIAKGRGGDHSTLGKVDAQEFCNRHYLSAWDSELVQWLVEKHLFMSMTAQRRDIADPEVIRDFAELVGDKLHLDYLYAMTVADICATNPTLWNAWRASLMRQLYLNTKRALRGGLEKPVNSAARIADKQQSARDKLLDHGIVEEQVAAIWLNASDEYFLRESVANIAWHTEIIATELRDDKPILIAIRDIWENTVEGATQVFIYAPNSDNLFASNTAAFERLNVNIHGARLFTCRNDYCINSYTILEPDGQPVGEQPGRISEIIDGLRWQLTDPEATTTIAPTPLGRLAKSFSQHIETVLTNNPERDYSTLELNCPDRPGILAKVGKVFSEHGINLRDARITTLGERSEDLFFITGKNGRAITDTVEMENLQSHLKEELSEGIEDEF